MDSLGTGFDLLLARGAIGALVVAALWAVAVVAAAVVEAWTQGQVQLTARVGCPSALRVWLVGLFVALFVSAAPAHAGDTGSGPQIDPALGPALDTALDGLPLPDRAPGRPAGGHVRVRPGDSLWRIAERSLPAGATTSTVATAVAQLYAANRTTVGPDPDLLRPGQRLVIDIAPGFPATTTPQEDS